MEPIKLIPYSKGSITGKDENQVLKNTLRCVINVKE